MIYNYLKYTHNNCLLADTYISFDIEGRKQLKLKINRT